MAATRGLSDTPCPFVLDSEGSEQCRSVLSEAFAMAAGAWYFCFSTSKYLPQSPVHPFGPQEDDSFHRCKKKEKSWCSYCPWTKSCTVVSEHIIHMPVASVSHLNQSEILTFSTGCLGLVHGDDAERRYGVEGGRGFQDWELMYTSGGFMSMYGKTNTVL